MHKKYFQRLISFILSCFIIGSAFPFGANPLLLSSHAEEPVGEFQFPTFSQWSDNADRESVLSSLRENNEQASLLNEILVTETVKTNDDELNLNCHSAILIEGTTGTVLYEKNPDEPLPIASVTKVMTILLIMEAIDSGNLKYEDVITVSENAASMGGSQAYLEVGEQITCRDLLKALVVSSANDAAVAFAEHIAGTLEAFISKMNDRAKALGMTNTSFVNTTGLDDSEIHYSTARDVSLMSAELMKHKDIKEFTTIWMDSIRNGKFTLSNTNKLIRFYPGATGLKTGYTSKAKFCLSASAEKNKLELIAVVLRADTSDMRFSDAKAMLNYGFANYSYYTPSLEIAESISVQGGKSDCAKITYDKSGMLCKKSDAAKITAEANLITHLVAPVDERQSVGSVIFKLDGKVISERPIITTESVERLSFGDILKKILKNLV